MEYSQYKEELLDAMKESFPGMAYSIENRSGINGYTDNLLGTAEGETYGLCQNVRHAYEAGASVESIVKGVMDNVLLHPMEKLDEFLKFENAKEHIVFRLLNSERNASLLQNVPHRKWNDLAIAYHIAPYDAVMRFVTDEMASAWNMTEEELWEIAKVNTPRKFPVFHESLVDFVVGHDDCPEEFGHLLKQVLGEKYLVISNTSKIFGASVILYDEAKGMFDSMYGDVGCFIIPINIHESVVAPADTGFSITALKETVDDLCIRYIVGDEFLTKTIYRYTPEDGVVIV